MIHIPTECDLAPSYTQFEPLSPVKPSNINIDLSDLLSSKTPQTPSCLSFYDTTSVRAEEEGPKPLLTIETRSKKGAAKGAKASKEAKERAELGVDDPKITIAEIISHKSFTRRQKDPNKEKMAGDSKLRKRKRGEAIGKDDDVKGVEDVVNKKEKLDTIGNYGGIDIKNEEPSTQYHNMQEVVIKDGKVQVVMKEVKSEIKVEKPMQVAYEKKKVTTSTSFRQVNHTEKWTEKETEKFYRALRLFGTDFSMIAKVFKNRNRNQVKNKFLKEEKSAAEKVNQTFKEFKPANLQALISNVQKYKQLQSQKAHQSQLESTQCTIQPTQQETQQPEKPQNLIMALTDTQDSTAIKQEEVIKMIVPIEGKEKPVEEIRSRSNSLLSQLSVDSIDKDIIEDLADILMPTQRLSFK